MKKFISAILSIAMVLSCVSISVQAEETETVTVTSSKYTIDTASKKISGVAPLTKVGAFESTFSGATVNVVNVDGTSMDDNAYATENVFVNVNGEIYKIDVEYPYDPIHTFGRNYRVDGDILFERASSQFNSTVNGQYVKANSGFAYAISGYKVGDGTDSTLPTVSSDNKTTITKQSENGEPIYVIENDAPRYAFLRSHYSGDTNHTELTNITNGKYSVTTVSFKTDKMGNFSLHHNAAGTVSGTVKADNPLETFVNPNYVQYLPNAIHFTEDGKVKIGGTYTNISTVAAKRTPAHTTSATWEAGKEYTVTVVQKLYDDNYSRNANVYGVYIDGEKIFPTESTQSSASSQFTYSSSKSRYSMNTEGDAKRYYGGISSIVLGAAPVNGDSIKLTLSDVKVYALDNLADFSANIDKELALENATGVTVDSSTSKINVYASETVASLRAKYTDYAISVYNSDGTQPAASANLETGMSAKIVSNDGLQTKLYGIIATTVVPESNVYTVDTAAKTISNVPLFTTVSAFLENFTNGDVLEVVNIDGSIMADDAYATEYVSLKTPSGDLYKINVNYTYDPINDSIQDNTVLFERKSLNINSTADDNQKVLDGSGFARTTSAYKLGDASGASTLPTVTSDHSTKITKQTENGEPVYVLENNAPRYAFLRSHYSDAAYQSQTQSPLTVATLGKVSVTSVTFKTDKMGNFSLHHNAAGSADGTFSGDGPFERFTNDGYVPYLPNAIHFKEDGTIKIGGTYTNIGVNAAMRTPAHETSAKWEAGKEYTVSVVQKVRDGDSRAAYVYGVYVNGTKIFPTSSAATVGTQYAYSSTKDAYSMNTQSGDFTYYGGISSVLVGAAPVNGDSIKLTLSDVKVYTLGAASEYKTAKDTQITIESNNGAISVDNGKAVISAMEAVDVADFTSTAKLKLENGYLKAVSADGLVMKTYKIVQEDLRTQFLNGENGPAITDLAAAGNSVCFMADVQDASLLDGVTPVVILGAYDKDTFKLLNCVIATGTAFTNEITRYKGVLDILEYNKEDIVLRGFVWDGFTNMDPLTSVSELK